MPLGGGGMESKKCRLIPHLANVSLVRTTLFVAPMKQRANDCKRLALQRITGQIRGNKRQSIYPVQYHYFLPFLKVRCSIEPVVS